MHGQLKRKMHEIDGVGDGAEIDQRRKRQNPLNYPAMDRTDDQGRKAYGHDRQVQQPGALALRAVEEKSKSCGDGKSVGKARDLG